jgi:hypothetical protein
MYLVRDVRYTESPGSQRRWQPMIGCIFINDPSIFFIAIGIIY